MWTILYTKCRDICCFSMRCCSMWWDVCEGGPLKWDISSDWGSCVRESSNQVPTSGELSVYRKHVYLVTRVFQRAVNLLQNICAYIHKPRAGIHSQIEVLVNVAVCVFLRCCIWSLQCGIWYLRSLIFGALVAVVGTSCLHNGCVCCWCNGVICVSTKL